MLCASGVKGATAPLTPVWGASRPPSPGKCDPFFFRTLFGRKTDRSCRVRRSRHGYTCRKKDRFRVKKMRIRTGSGLPFYIQYKMIPSYH